VSSPAAKRIPDDWVDYLLGQPETGMGYWIVSVRLQDGRSFDRVVVNDGLVTQVYGHREVPFEPEDIVEMRVTHDKWTFNP
jgi:hypothetical protein